jgi:prophage antirepressor-like protein
MEANLEIFEKKEFGSIKVELVDGNVIFNLGDVTKILDLDPHDVKKRLIKSGLYDRIEKTKNGTYVPSEYISEPNLYRCVMQSKKPEAERFQDWVVEEVLPSIRKHGAYITGEKLEEVLSDPQKMIDILTDLVNERKLRESTQKELEVAKPKAEYYDKILDSKDLLNVTSIAKSLGMTSQELNKILLKLGVTMGIGKKKKVYGLTYRYCNGGYGNVKEFPIFDKEGNFKFYKKLLVYTEKGKELICKLLLEKGFIKTNEDGSVIPNENKILEFLKEESDNED